MRHHINGNRHCQNENVILPGVNLHAIGIRKLEPFLRHLGESAISFE